MILFVPASYNINYDMKDMTPFYVNSFHLCIAYLDIDSEEIEETIGALGKTIINICHSSFKCYKVK